MARRTDLRENADTRFSLARLVPAAARFATDPDVGAAWPSRVLFRETRRKRRTVPSVRKPLVGGVRCGELSRRLEGESRSALSALMPHPFPVEGCAPPPRPASAWERVSSERRANRVRAVSPGPDAAPTTGDGAADAATGAGSYPPLKANAPACPCSCGLGMPVHASHCCCGVAVSFDVSRPLLLRLVPWRARPTQSVAYACS
jgi:hypothetical protein